MHRSTMLKCPTLIEGMGVIVSLYGLGKSSPHEPFFLIDLNLIFISLSY